MGAHVVLELLLLGEDEAANGAGIPLLARVRPHMRVAGALVAEGALAVRALVRLDTQVNPDELEKIMSEVTKVTDNISQSVRFFARIISVNVIRVSSLSACCSLEYCLVSENNEKQNKSSFFF